MAADKKYQIFISSTFADLKDERQAAMNSVIDLRHIPIGMEGFPAVDEKQLDYICRLIDECDYYVLIIKNRYGSISDNGQSFTQREYDHAVARGKYVLAFINDSESDDDSDNPSLIRSFKNSVSEERVIKPWVDLPSLELSVFKSLARAFEVSPQVGWVKGDLAADPALAAELNKANRTIRELNAELSGLRTPVVMPNLAGLDAVHTVNFSYFSQGSQRRGTLEATFLELFLAVGSTFRVARTPAAANSPLEVFAAAKGKNTYNFSVTEDAKITIVNQFELLGLMRSFVSKTTDNSTALFYQVTEHGETVLKTGKAVKNAG